MDILATPETFARVFDHTLLKADATQQAIDVLVNEALRFQFAAVCVNPCHVATVAPRLEQSRVRTCAVVGFPLGANTSRIKAEEARQCVDDGAQEIDMVINLGSFLAGESTFVVDEIESVQQACGDAALKVIFETAYLSESQIRFLATACAKLGIDFVKTSTGMGPRGASVQDIVTMREAIAAVPGAHTQIKASGGIRALAHTRDLIVAGARRIGASASVKILKEFQQSV